MPLPSFEAARARILEFSRRYASGRLDAFDATRELLNFLLSLTVAKVGQTLRFRRSIGAAQQARVIGDSQQGLLALNDGRYLRVLVSLKLEFDESFGANKLLPIEAVIRLLADQFKIHCNTDPTFWRPLLSESERAFNDIAHKPLSGPPHERPKNLTP